MARTGIVRMGALLVTLAAAALLLRAEAAAVRPVRINATPPELTGGPWLNTPGSKPLTLASLKGKVVVVHYWTFG
ncbi:MAG: hypothetical protein ACO1SX_15070 [Actinomycetota bacterium]